MDTATIISSLFAKYCSCRQQQFSNRRQHFSLSNETSSSITVAAGSRNRRQHLVFAKDTANIIASLFALANLFARGIGGWVSDKLFATIGFRGRLWAQFVSLLLVCTSSPD